MIRMIGLIGLAVLLVGCGVSDGGGAAVETPVLSGVETAVPVEAQEIDEATGLPLNPPAVIEGEFIVEGVVNAVSLIPKDKPLFKVRTPSGAFYQINAQPVSDIFMADGTALKAADFQPGMTVRATVVQGDDVGLGGEPVLTSMDLIVLALKN